MFELTDASFQQEVIESDQPVLVEFWAPWCQPCVEMLPAMEQIAEEFSGRAIVGRVQIDRHERLASRYDVDAPPTTMVFRSGRLFRRRSGLQSVEALRGLLDAALESTPDVISRSESTETTNVRIVDE